MRTDPGSDELSPGDARPAPPPEEPVFYRKPFIPEPPDLGEP